MSRPVQIVCDGCGKVKQQSNHWWIVAVEPQALLVASDDLRPQIQAQFDFCGTECALKFISEHMGKQAGK